MPTRRVAAALVVAPAVAVAAWLAAAIPHAQAPAPRSGETALDRYVAAADSHYAWRRVSWTAYFVELTFPSGGKHPFTLTTPVRVVPETLPFPPPGPGPR